MPIYETRIEIISFIWLDFIFRQ